MPNNIALHLVELGIINAIILDEAVHFPGFAEIQDGIPLSPQQIQEFRRTVAKTILLYQERRAAIISFTKLLRSQGTHQWIHHFAPFASDMCSALQPIIKTVCFTMNWPYAEVWCQHDTSGSRTLKVARSFTYVYKRWLAIEPHLQKLTEYMSSYSIALPSREVPSDAFTSRNQIWGEKCTDKIKDEKRLKFLSDASLDKAFIVPLQSGSRQNVTRALVFYGEQVNRDRALLARQFLIPAAQNAVDSYKTVEVIGADEKESHDAVSSRWGQLCTRHGLLRAAKLADRTSKIQRSRSFTCATNALGEKL